MSADYMDICEQLSRENEQLRAQVAALEARLREAGEQVPVGIVGDDNGLIYAELTDRSVPAGTQLYAAAPVPAQPAARTVGDAREITNAIILDVCETDPADPSHPETVCINVDDLRETVERHILAAKGDTQ